MEKEPSNAKIGRPVRVPGEQDTKKRIFEKAVELFSEYGFDRTTTRQIALSVGLTEGAIYRHYTGKEAILEAILAFAEESIYTPLPVELNLKENKNESIFSALLNPLPEIMLAQPIMIKIMRIIYSEIFHNEKISNFFVKEFVKRADDHVEALFRVCIEKGMIRDCDLRILARMFNAIRTKWAFETFLITPEEIVSIGRMKKDLQQISSFLEQAFLSKRGKNHITKMNLFQ